MNIAIIGLGYVGCVSAACLAKAGHHVVGVDVNSVKVDLINKGLSPIVEQDIDSLIAENVANGHLSATTDINEAIAKTDLSLICVGTPSRSNGSLDLTYIQKSVAELARALKDKKEFHVLAVRSTMLPGTLENVVQPILEKESGKKVGVELGLAVNPEFLREGTAVKDYYNPAFTLIGVHDDQSAAPLREIYQIIDAPIIQTEIRVTEMVKYSSNVFHALKVGFANELGVLCKKMDIDSHLVMDIFKQDKQLNISPTYLTPGFAFGGSCLPKDIRAIVHKSRELDLDLRILSSILPSNQDQIERAFDMIQATKKKKIGILGLSFKAGTDDLRESPTVQLAEKLLGKGYELCIYDNNVTLANLVGANRQYIEEVIPHLAGLMVEELDKVLDSAEVLVIGNNATEFQHLSTQLKPDHRVVDLVRLDQDFSKYAENYQGLCW